MSVTALKPVLREIRADGNITLAEAQKLVAPKNGLGAFTDKDEFEIFTRLAKDIKKSEPAALPSKQKVADVNANNKTRLINKGLKIAGIASPIAAVATIAAVLTLAFAAPATPSTLSRLILTSAIIIVQMALYKEEDSSTLIFG